MKILKKFSLLALIGLLTACSPGQKTKEEKEKAVVTYNQGEFGYDLDFLKKYHPDLVMLSDDSARAQLIVLPAYQGRVMTSTAAGEKGMSYGWVNHEAIRSGELKEHINVYGGEERFWLGPEGGQYSIYFKKGVEFKFENWFVPKQLDTEPFDLVNKTQTSASFTKDMHLENYSGNKLDVKVDRTIRLLSRDSIENLLQVNIPADVAVVAYESENVITNIGSDDWTKKSGLLSIWILSMLNASEYGVIGVPFKTGDEKRLGRIVTDTYFGKVPEERLKVKEDFLIFKADAKYRSKIGISPQRAQPWICSYDSDKEVLTIAQFTVPENNTTYVNSLWEQQKEPYKGDAINAYNDGPVEDGTQLGKFYEIESSSPAAELKKGESLKHVHRTIHFQGPRKSLDEILKGTLSFSVSDLTFD
jgi:hypothetical protein